MPPNTRTIASHYFCIFLILLSFSCKGDGQSKKDSKLIFKEDLQRFGYTFHEGPGVLSIYGDLAFLSNDLLLVSVRESPGKRPRSTMLLLNVREQRVVRSTELPVREVSNAVIPIQYSRFLMLSNQGWQICSVEFVCGEPLPTAWPVSVSPDGSRATMGGFRQQRWIELNPTYSSLQESWQNGTAITQAIMQAPDQTTAGIRIERFLSRRFPPIAGETGWLFATQSTTSFQVPGKQKVDLRIGGEARFVNSARVIGIKKDKATMVTLDGTMIYQVPGKLHARASFITCSSGQRFGIFELGYRGMSSWIDFGDENGAFNLARVRVFDVASGHQLFDHKWDPGHDQSFSIKPVMSPDGHRVAIVMRGQLLVYEIP
jgi:hypothetical protein